MGFCASCGDIVRGVRCRCGGRPKPSSNGASDTPARTDPWSSTYLARRFGEALDVAPPRRARPISMPPKAAEPAVARTNHSARSPTARSPPQTPLAKSPVLARSRPRALTNSPHTTRTRVHTLKPEGIKPIAIHHYTHNAYCPPPVLNRFPTASNEPLGPPKVARATSNQGTTPPAIPRAATTTPKAAMPALVSPIDARCHSSADGEAMVHNGIQRVGMAPSCGSSRECTECHKSLSATERQTSPLRPGAVYCDDCYSHSFSKGFCFSCKRLILTHGRPWVQYKDRVWHKMCLSCVQCGKLLLRPVVDLSGNPCCEPCFLNQRGSRALVSDEPSPLTTALSAPSFPDPTVIPPFQKKLSSSPRSPLATVIQAHPFERTPSPHSESNHRRSSVDTTSLRLPSQIPASHRQSITEQTRTASMISDELPSSKVARPDSGCSELRKPASTTTTTEMVLALPAPSEASAQAPVATPTESDTPTTLADQSFTKPSSAMDFNTSKDLSTCDTPVNSVNASMTRDDKLPPEPKASPYDLLARPRPTPTDKLIPSASVSRASSTTPVSTALTTESPAPPTRTLATAASSDKASPSFRAVTRVQSNTSVPSTTTPSLSATLALPATAQRCARCHTQINDTWFRLTDGRQLHPECFTCSGCQTRIEDGMYVIDQGMEYHQRCIPVKPPIVSTEPSQPDPAADHCDRCRGVLDGPRFQLTNGKRYHPGCFICSGCSQLFEEGTYVCYEGKEYHRECVPKVNVLRCGKCRSLINGIFVRHNSQSFHPHCFTCHGCDCEITPQMPFGELQGASYCEHCLNFKLSTASTVSSIQNSPMVRPYAVSAAMSLKKRGANSSSPSRTTSSHISKVVY
ncbi:hypothetical protein H4R35_006466 [Dimargaris xerosporica]|nr:hypothetical protein H4R35_006466 [Dimargaris xerosporica]